MKSWIWILIVLILSSNLVGCSRNPNSPSGEIGGKSELPAPSQKMLNEVLSNLKTIRLIDCNMDKAGNLIGKNGKKVKGTGDVSIVYESSEPQVLKDLAQYLILRDNAEVDKSIYGTLSVTNVPTLELALCDGRAIHLGVIDGRFLRWKEWRHEAVLKELAFVIWLARHGVSKPALTMEAKLDQAIREYEEEKKASKKVSVSKGGLKRNKSRDGASIAVPSVIVPKSKLPVPSQKMLDEVFSKLKTIRILDCNMDSNGNLKGRWVTNITGNRDDFVIFESSEPKELNDLSRLLLIEDDSKVNKSYYGSSFDSTQPTLQLTQADGREIYLGMVDAGILRCKDWRNEAFLNDGMDFVSWLARHGVTSPALESKVSIFNALWEYEKRQTSFDQFVQNMPKSLRSFLGTITRLESSANLEDMSENYGKIPTERRLKLAKMALSKEFPKDSDQIGVLLEWKGKFTIDWAGSYQSFPIELLTEYKPSQVMSVVKSSRLTTAQWIGLCRYYSDLRFRQKFPSGYKPLDKKLQLRIIKEVRSTRRNDYDIEDFKYALEHWMP